MRLKRRWHFERFVIESEKPQAKSEKAGVALVLAALTAERKSTVAGAVQVDFGYERLDDVIQ